MSSNRPPVDASDDPPPKVTRKIADEAATWVARLHGPDRTREMELECLKWQSRSAANRYAFERCTEVWMEVPNAARAAGYVPTPRLSGGGVHRSTRKPLWVAASSMVVVAATVATWAFWTDGTGYRTAVGEAQTVMLKDGTRMFLNTDTRVHVDLASKQRTVSLESGEAAFEVAKEPARPFVVRAAASEVVALGTAFSVRLTPANATAGESLAVTLLEGQVSLRPLAHRDDQAVAPAQALVMKPGDRVRLAKAPGRNGATQQQLDRPQLDQVTAWKRNEAVFDRTSLADAVAEMNRYSRTPLVLMGDLAQADWQVSGHYRTGDNAGFANALAAVHGLVVRDGQGRLELSRAP
jgi:transmembrane sensor